MDIDRAGLSTDELARLIADAGVEYAQREKSGSPNPPPGSFDFSYDEPFLMGVDGTDDKVILRARSSFYGWVNFKWSREAIEMMQNMVATCLANGVSPSSTPAAGVRSSARTMN